MLLFVEITKDLELGYVFITLYVHKGDKLYVEGKIFTRSYDDQSGIKRYVTEIYVDEMEMLTPKSTQPGTAQATAPQQATQQGIPANEPDTPF